MNFEVDPYKEGWGKMIVPNFKGLMWHIDDLDKDLQLQLVKRNITAGSFLDIGAGHGTQSNILQQIGFNVTAIDVNQSMLDYAKTINNNVEYICDNFMTRELPTYDYAFDRGCFHLIYKQHRNLYVDTIHKLVNKLFFLKVSSDKNLKHNKNPLSFTSDEVISYFQDKFEICEVIHGTFSDKVSKEQLITNQKHSPIKSIFLVLSPIKKFDSPTRM